MQVFESCIVARAQGPVQNLNDHLSSPGAVNAFNFATSAPACLLSSLLSSPCTLSC